MQSDSASNSDIPDDAPYNAWRLPLLSRDEFAALGNEPRVSVAQLRYLAHFGLLAPTTHNTVPQRFRIRATGKMDVLVDRRYVLPVSDPTGRQALISLGCVLANIEFAARLYGRSVRVNFSDAHSSDLTPLPRDAALADACRQVMSLDFRPSECTGDLALLRLVMARKVVRAEYDRQVTLPSALEARLYDIVHSDKEGVQLALHLFKDAASLRALGKFQEQAERFVFENSRFTRELGKWLLPNDDSSACLGMRGREFGFDDAFSKQVHFALQGERPMLPDQIAGFAKGSRLGLEGSTAALVFSTTTDDLMSHVLSGRAAQLVSLELLREGFCSAYQAAMVEVDWVREMVSASVLKTTRVPCVVLRTGKPKVTRNWWRPHSSRPALDGLIID